MNIMKKQHNKFFSPSEQHIPSKKWPACDCMTCASDYEDSLTTKDLELGD